MKTKLYSFIILSLILLSGCAPSFEVQKMVLTSVYDFTEYTEKGFFCTPEQYLYDYE